MFVIVGSSNAVNLTDGLDGLASGCTDRLREARLPRSAYLSRDIELLSDYLSIPLHSRRVEKLQFYWGRWSERHARIFVV